MQETLSALLAGVAKGECHWVRAPQGTPTPYVVMQRLPGTRQYHNQGPSGYVEERVQFDVYAKRYGDADVVMRHLTATLSGYRGAATGSGAILAIFIGETPRDLPVDDASAGGRMEAVNRLGRLSTDAMVHSII